MKTGWCMAKILMALLLSFSSAAFAQSSSVVGFDEMEENILDDLDPQDPKTSQLLERLEHDYESETGERAYLPDAEPDDAPQNRGCRRDSCKLWVQVVKSRQLMYVYLDGQLYDSWAVSTGLGNSTPNFDKHPNGRIFQRYTSTKYPGGNYRGLGNMPYAVFISGNFAIHGTPASNWKRLGRKASHGCIRLHPENAEFFNRLVRSYGVQNVWITVQN